jgi:hypothetical protein
MASLLLRGGRVTQTFDIFKRLADGQPEWIEAVEGLEEARACISRLTSDSLAEYFIVSPIKGCRQLRGDDRMRSDADGCVWGSGSPLTLYALCDCPQGWSSQPPGELEAGKQSFKVRVGLRRPMPSPLRILIADDDEAIRNGLRSVLESHSGWVVCGQAGEKPSAHT